MNTNRPSFGPREDIIPNRAKPGIAQLLARVAFFWLVYGLVFLLGAGGLLAGLAPRAWQGFVLGTTGSVGTFVFTWWLVRREGLRLQDIGLAWKRGSVGRFLIGAALGVAFFSTIAAIGVVFDGWRWERSPGMGLGAVGMNAITFLALGALEELGFRGYPLRRLERRLGLWGAQFVVAAMFGLSHYAQGWPWLGAFVGTGLGSVLFGMAAVATRGLAVPIGLHAAINLTDWMLGGKETAGFWKPVAPGGPMTEHSHLVGMIGYCSVLLVGIAGFWQWHRRNEDRTPTGPV